MSKKTLTLLIVLCLLTVGAFLIIRIDSTDEDPPEPSHLRQDDFTFVGGQSCVKCHEKEHREWTGSHHDLAMEAATEETVFGDFNNTTFTHYSVTSTFYRKDGGFFVQTDGPDGKLQDYEIKYTFGFNPLQQYLVEFPGGRYQTLALCWDTRLKEEGGQRWFHIYDQEEVPHTDILHWTGIYQNWNYMCAECHSTNVKKNYDYARDRYNTTWSEIDVSCEACHGPGSLHVEWADAVKRGEKPEGYGHMGLAVRLKDPDKGTWVFDRETGVARRTTPRRSRTLIEMCVRCHARRSTLIDEYRFGHPILDTHRVAFLEEPLYFVDGQIKDEVYVYGSFLQSKMYQKGVACNDCHNSHSMRLRAQDNALCYRCHLYQKYGTKTHHFHKPDSTGALCVECHMPERTYMVIDPRRDHSIRSPRPDLALKLGTPDACSRCHKDKTVKWNAEALVKWYGEKLPQEKQIGEILFAVDQGVPSAEALLLKLIDDPNQPEIIRASALLRLQNYPPSSFYQTLQKALRDGGPLIRLAALSILTSFPMNIRLDLAQDLLDDPIRSVRMEAARLLAAASQDFIREDKRSALKFAWSEYLESYRHNADRPDAHLNMGLIYTEMKEYEKAETEYKEAIRISPYSYRAFVNLADLYRLLGQDNLGEETLFEALRINPDNAAAHHALGLLLIRNKQVAEAIPNLRQAAELEPYDPRFNYVYGIALSRVGKTTEALSVLTEAQRKRPYNQELLYALATINRDVGKLDNAHHYAEKLVSTYPNNPDYRKLLAQVDSLRAQ